MPDETKIKSTEKDFVEETEKDEATFHTQAIERFRKDVEHDQDERSHAVEDLYFYIATGQWPESVKSQRDKANRPCLTINRTRGFVNYVVGDMRQNKIGIKVRPRDSQSDPKTANIIEGLTRQIESVSDAQDAYISGGENAVVCGRGAWRVNIKYLDDDSFDQDLEIERIPNQMSVYWDSSATRFDLTDADHIFITASISEKAYKQKYPNAKTQDSWDVGTGDDKVNWTSDEDYVIAEYWYKTPVKKTIYQLTNGMVCDRDELQDVLNGMMKDNTGLLLDIADVTAEDEKGNLIPNEIVFRGREVDSYKIQWCKMAGGEVLEGPYDWPGKYIPIVMVWGKEIYIEGKRYTWGLVRDLKDPARMYNYWRSADAEVVGGQSREPYLLTSKMIKGHEAEWNTATATLLPYKLYEPDLNIPGGKPTREQPPQVSPGLFQQAMLTSDEMKQVTGLYDSALGEKSQEVSGVAINARAKRSDIANFVYMDNLARAIRHTGKIIVDLVPKVYDGERIIRTRGVDDQEEEVKINETVVETTETGDIIERILNDITVGKYDVVVTTGPSHATQRTEAAEMMLQVINARPDLMNVFGDKLMANMDIPGGDELAERMAQLLDPRIQAYEETQQSGEREGVGGGQGQGIPPEMMGMEQGAEGQGTPEETEVAKIKVAQEEAKLEGIQLDNEKKRFEVEGARVKVQAMGVSQ